ncbi:NAD-dependent epimerase/dehydratase family protein [Microbacterium pygmaeum]|uniref:Nucleoside-diphosphate-sugar epimerase n=1 Tax=Microbacterium pygmaeum TaxID=370764 RepID=A0A1G7VZ06_9MICO|nr:NAD(P)-dependent oxidoreductase [Microbacterium pygmaeum]SDG64891.1 Nucleoside-diphosphate-sugar epimerase [Microbacterium pygmaeum]
MRIVVTGAAGRLGRSVAQALRDAGHAVLSVDRAFAPGDEGETADLTDRDATEILFTRLAPDAVVHLAAIAVPFSAPEHTIFTVNTAMAHSVLEAAVAAGASRVLVASSPTVLGYGSPTWDPGRLPLDERSPRGASNSYALSKICIEETVAAFARREPSVRFGAFRPCYVISPEEWSGAPTQQGHTVLERLERPELAAVSLFNYVDARDVAAFVGTWLEADRTPPGAVYVVGAADSLAVEPVAALLAHFHPGTTPYVSALDADAPVFSSAAAARDLGWRPTRSWRTELAPEDLARLESPRGPALDGSPLPQKAVS